MFKRFNRGIAAMLAIVVISTLLEQPFPALAAEISQKNMITISVRSSQNSALVSRLDIAVPKSLKHLSVPKRRTRPTSPLLMMFM